MFCSKCGSEVANGAQFCPNCGNRLQAVRVEADPGLATLIPHNTYALWAYYLGLFSVLCGITAIPAFIAGILGIRYAKQHPEAKGAVHAWVGVIMGAICFAVVVLALLMVISG